MNQSYKIEPLALKGLFLITPKIIGDDRGHFSEILLYEDFFWQVSPHPFIQENESSSHRGVLRGLHLQRDPYPQGKLVRCLAGRIVDVAVDLRPDSETYGRHVAIELDNLSKQQLFIPRGFAHGFLALTDEVVVNYKVDNSYHPEAELSIAALDPVFSIDWLKYGVNREEILQSEKDRQALSFAQYKQVMHPKL